MHQVTVNAEKKAEIDARIAASNTDTWFVEQVAAGFLSSTGIRLGLSSDDVTLLTGNFVLAKEAAASELPIPPVIDADGVPHELTIEELTQLMLEYGQHRASLSAEYARRKSEV